MADEEAIVGDEAEIAPTEPTETEAVEPEAEDVEAVDAEASDGEEMEAADGEDGEEPDGEDDAEDDEDVVELTIGGNAKRFDSKQTAKEAAAELQKFADETWSAHTKRSQEVAEMRKSVEASAEAMQKLQHLNDEQFKAYAQAATYDQSIAVLQQQLDQIDYDQDPDAYRRTSDTLVRYRQESERARQYLQQAEAATAREQQLEMASRQDENAAKIKRKLKGFDEAQLLDYVEKEYGIERNKAATTWALDERVAEMAFKAMKYDSMQRASRKKSAPVKPKAEPVKSRARKGGAAPQSLENMSPEAFHRMRMKQRAQARP